MTSLPPKQTIDVHGLEMAYVDTGGGGPHTFVLLHGNPTPGMILTGAQRETCRSWPNQEEVTLPGLHYLQEDSGPEMGGRSQTGWRGSSSAAAATSARARA